MKRTRIAIAASLSLVGTIGLIGCASQQDGSAGTPAAAPSTAATEQPANVDPAVAKAMGQLSAEDRTAAEKQKNCPVTDEPLGSIRNDM